MEQVLQNLGFTIVIKQFADKDIKSSKRVDWKLNIYLYICVNNAYIYKYIILYIYIDYNIYIYIYKTIKT